MEPKPGVYWPVEGKDDQEDDQEQDQPQDPTPSKPGSKVKTNPVHPTVTVRAHDRSRDLRFRFDKADIFLHLWHKQDWEKMDCLCALLGHDSLNRRASQLLGEIVRDLLSLPGVYPPLKPLEAKKPLYGTWWIPVLEGEITLRRGKSDVCLSYQDAMSPQDIQTALLAALQEPLATSEDNRLANRLRVWPRQQACALFTEARQALEEGGSKQPGSIRREVEREQTEVAAVLRDLGVARHAPQQLPALPSEVVERSQVLKLLRGQKPDHGAWMAGAWMAGLRGMGGSGKTTLAVALANKWKSVFPDGQLFLPLAKSGAASPQAEQEQVRRWLQAAIRAFGAQEQLPGEISELEIQYRDTLSSRRVLVLLDNVQSPAQITPFLPPAGCGLIVTSRQAFSLGTAPVHLLDRMEEEEASQLLRNLYAPLSELEIRQLVALCAGSPLALCIVGNNLFMDAAERGGRASVSTYLRRLKAARLAFLDEKSPYVVENTVTETLRLSEEGITEAEKAAWWKLSVFPADFDAVAAAAVAGIFAGTVAGASDGWLEKLVRRSLLERFEERYRLHDLVRDYTQTRLEENAPVAHRAHRDHASHYLSLVLEQNLLFLRGGSSMMASLAWFDEEWSNIEAGQNWARETTQADSTDTEAARFCVDFPRAAANFLSLRVHPRQEMQWLLSALQVCEALKHPGREEQEKMALVLHNLGLGHSKLGETEAAITYYQKSLSVIIEIKHLTFEVICRGNLGWVDLHPRNRPSLK